MSPAAGPQPIEWANAAQEQAFRYGPYPLCLSGGFAAAKTYAGCLKILWLCDTFPGNRVLIYRQLATDLRKTTLATLSKLLPRSRCKSWNSVDGIIELPNGSCILAMHMDNPDLESVIKGLEINAFLGDQAEDTAEEIFDKLRSRLGRWDKATVPDWIVQQHERATGRSWPWLHPTTGKRIPPIYALLTCNPDTDLHWIYARFHPESPEWQEKWSKLGYRMIQFSARDNKFLPKQTLDEMLSQDPTFVRRFVDGEWGIPEGVIHEVKPESIVEFSSAAEAEAFLDNLRRTAALYRTLDHGESSPTCCVWWAVDRDENVWAIREYYMPNKLVSYHREQIRSLSEGEVYTWSLADPSIFNKGTGGQKHGQFWTVADEWADRQHGYSERDAVNWSPADNNELGTRNRINEYLRIDPERIHPITKQKGSPRLFFLKRNEHYPQGCVNVIRETRAQRHECLGTVNGKKSFSDDRDDTIPDHGYDCCRYMLASRSPIASAPARRGGAGSFDAKRRLLERTRRGPVRA